MRLVSPTAEVRPMLLRQLRSILMMYERNMYRHFMLSLYITPKISAWQKSISKTLIIISNMSLVNPGPANKISVVYQNV